MKKTVTIISVIFLLLFGGLVLMRNVNFNRIGKDEYYTQIIGEGEEVESEGSSGEIYTDYEYELPAYNEDGDKQILSFTAQKQLREDAYLLVYVKEGDDVTSYQEVEKDEIPKQVAQNLE